MTPFLKLDPSKAERAYRALVTALPAGTRTHFAMKANPHPSLLCALNEAGTGFEVASYAELAQLIALGITHPDVLFSNPIKSGADIARTAAAGVRRFAFDSEGEANKIADAAPHSAVYVRLKTASSSGVPSEGKFGVGVDRAVQLMLYAKSIGLEPYGVAFHVGSQTESGAPWRDAITRSAAVIDQLLSAGVRIQTLNLGGGFPAAYADTPPSLITTIGAAIKDALVQLSYPVQLLAEPGRCLAAPTGVLVASVIGVADRGSTRWVHLDVGAFNGLMEALETGNRLAYPVRDSRGQSTLLRCRLTGPTCDSQDTIMDAAVSATLTAGDRVAFLQAGAYTSCYAAPAFNGFAAPTLHVMPSLRAC